jgi:ATP-dependent Clp protease ATP-binding subunit ClpC
MHPKLAKPVEHVIKAARALAREADQEYLGTEHVLLAIRMEDDGVAARLLDRFRVDEHRLRAEIARLAIKSMEETWVFGRLPGSPHLKNVIATAVDLAKQMGSDEVAAQHLLLAMLKEKGSIAYQAIKKLGMTYDAAQDAALEFSAKE